VSSIWTFAPTLTVCGLLLAKVARRVNDPDVLAVLTQMLKASGNQGVPQGGVISPLLSNLYLTEVDRMLERAKAVTRSGQYTAVEYARFADDLVILVDAHPRHAWLLTAVTKRLREELASLQVEVNEDKSRLVDLTKGETFGFLGFTIRRLRSKRGGLVAAADASAEEADRGAARAQGGLSALSVPAHPPGDRPDQPDAPRLGPVLRGRERESGLLLRPERGGAGGAAAPDAGTESSGPRVDEVESAVAV
jgi:RNA-directed DNA polymerase